MNIGFSRKAVGTPQSKDESFIPIQCKQSPPKEHPAMRGVLRAINICALELLVLQLLYQLKLRWAVGLTDRCFIVRVGGTCCSRAQGESHKIIGAASSDLAGLKRLSNSESFCELFIRNTIAILLRK